ncbi:MAG TPA: glycine oxidase ThiO [Candidatus Methylomirabilis sp.]|nr:glycine oxidase ThiO [Candidatus Methylomirabilis sp.]
MPIQKHDVLIVGGGIIGCSIAYFLAKAGVRPLVLERDQVGAEASSGAAGLLTAQAHSDETGPLLDLKLASRALYATLAVELRERMDIDIEYRTLGHLVPALTDAELIVVNKRVAWQASLGLPAVRLTAHEARELEPGLTPEVKGGGWFPEDHHVNNTAVTQALASATMRLGGQVRTGTAVVEVLWTRERVAGVRTTQETVAADTVVLCAGAWSRDFEASAGLPLPIVPAKGQIVVARLEMPALRHVVYGEAGYAIPRASGEHILGSTVEYVGYDKRVTLEGLAGIMAGITRMVPTLQQAEMAASWGCLRPAAPDGLPLLGRVSGREGLVVATGHFRNGILLAPITGKLIAELIVEGKASIPLDPFRPDRPFPSGLPPQAY